MTKITLVLLSLLLTPLLLAPGALTDSGEVRAASVRAGAAAPTGTDEHERWLKDIPDYEKRLYDRVKGINQRVVRIFNVLIAGVVLLLVVVPGTVYLALCRRDRGERLARQWRPRFGWTDRTTDTIGRVGAAIKRMLWKAFRLPLATPRFLARYFSDFAREFRENPKAMTALMVFTITISVTVVEIGIRVYRDQNPNSFLAQLNTYGDLFGKAGSYYRSETFNTFSLKPNFRGRTPSQEHRGTFAKVAINNVGLRGPEITEKKPPGVKRVLVLGDSYTFGVYVENTETYPAVLEKILREDGYTVEVLNAGYASGHCPSEHYSWLVNRGLDFKPDIVLYGFFIGNDLNCLTSTNTWRELDARGLPIKTRRNNMYIDDVGYLRWRTGGGDKRVGTEFVYRIPLIRDLYVAVAARQGIEFLIEKAIATFADESEKQRRGWWRPSQFQWLFYETSNPEMLKAEERFYRLVEGMDAVTRENGGRFALVMIPLNFQVEPKLLRHVDRSEGLETGPIELRNYFEEMKPRLEARGIRFLDLLEPMTRQPGPYFPNNGEVHFNANGHAFTARKLTPVVHSLLQNP